MPVEKNKEYIVEIVDNGFQGEGIARVNNFTIFIPNAIKGEKVRILVVKVLTSYAFGKIKEIIEPSKYRISSDCNTYKRCGGCNLRHIDYKYTLKMKQNQVQSLVNKNLKNKIEVGSTVGMENPYHYRNKAQLPVGIDKDGQPTIGVYANRTHEIIPIENCMIQNEQTQKVAKSILEFIKKNNISIYDEEIGKGLIRHLVIKVGINTNELMCIIVINGKEIPKQEKLIKELISKFPNIKSIVKNINTKNTNVILGKQNEVIYGNDYIKDKLGEYTFRISPLSFYQVNPIQTEKLYDLAIEKAEVSKEDVVYDLYCGIGTISIFTAKHAKKVYGIEIVKEAIEFAKENAKINNIENAEFYAGDVEEELTKLLEKDKPTIIMLDPPRKGIDNKTIENILNTKPKKVIYISCNPATLMRDISKLEDKYNLKSITPVDMFPFTRTCRVCCSIRIKTRYVIYTNISNSKKNLLK